MSLTETTQHLLRGTVSGSVEDVWAMWTKPEKITQWWHTSDTQIVAGSVRAEVHPAGVIAMRIRDADGGTFVSTSVVTTAVPPHTLILAMENSPLARLQVEIESLEARTQSRVSVSLTMKPAETEFVRLVLSEWSDMLRRMSSSLRADNKTEDEAASHAAESG